MKFICRNNFHKVFILWLSILSATMIFFLTLKFSTSYSRVVVDCAPAYFSFSTMLFLSNEIIANGWYRHADNLY